MRLSVRGFTFDLHPGGPADGPPVLLLHGFPQHSGQWEAVAGLLHAAGLRTVAFDQRGYSPGARPVTVDAYRQAECVADAVAVLDALGLDDAHVVGHDWGALVSWQLAARHPGRVRSLTAVSAPHPQAIVEATIDGDQRERSAYIGLFRQAGKAEQVLLAENAARLRAMLAGVPPERIEGYVDRMREDAALTAALNWYRALSPDDLAGLGPVTVPTTYLWSDQDPAFGRDAAVRCASHVTGDYRFVELAGVSHWVPDEAPGAVADEVLARAG